MIQITTFEMISELDRIFKKHPAAGITASVHNVGTSNNFLKDYDSRMQMAIQIVGQICRGLVDGNRERVALDIEIDSKTGKAFARYEFKLIDNRLNVRRFNAGVAGWEYEYILVDGHNRFEISEKHGLKYNVSYLDLYDIDDVKDWMNKNQLGRRNIHPKHFKILLGRIYNRTKKAASGRNDRNFGVTKKVTPKTHQQIADAFGIAQTT